MSAPLTLAEAQHVVDELLATYPAAMITDPMRTALRLTLEQLPGAEGMVPAERFQGFLAGVRRYLRERLH